MRKVVGEWRLRALAWSLTAVVGAVLFGAIVYAGITAHDEAPQVSLVVTASGSGTGSSGYCAP